MSNVIHLFSKEIVSNDNFNLLIKPAIPQPYQVQDYIEAENKPKRKERIKMAGMKFYPRSNQWKASNVFYDVANETAYSYDWWRFVERINGHIVFNDYSYSNTTRRHQSKVRNLLDQLDIQVTFEIEAPKGLQDLESSIKHYQGKIKLLEHERDKPKSRAAKNAERNSMIHLYNDKLDIVNTLIKARNEAAS